MSITEQPFGQLEDGREVQLYTLSNPDGTEVRITNYGGIITSLIVPDREGRTDDIVLGFDNLQDYLQGHPCFGALIGRYGNRIAKSRFELDGKKYQLAANEGENHLHGGEKGFDKVLWSPEIMENGSLRLSYLSPDGEEGYPGALAVSVIYTLTDENEFTIAYEAATDKTTHLNLTSHSYFNLGGDPSVQITDHQLKLHSDAITAVDDQLIPTGEIREISGTPFDFADFQQVGSRIHELKEGGYDHNYVLRGVAGSLKIAAEIYDPSSGRKLKIHTTEPGIQFYTGNSLDGTLVSPNGIRYEKHAGLCLEAQHFPNSPNIPEFPTTVLHPGETFKSQTIYSFSVESAE